MNCEPKKYRGLMIATIVLGAILMVLGILSYPLTVSSTDAVKELIEGASATPAVGDIIMKMIPLMVVVGAFFLIWIAYAVVAGITANKSSKCNKVSLKPAIIAVLVVSIILFIGVFGGSMGWFANDMVPSFSAESKEAAMDAIGGLPKTMYPLMIGSIVSGAAVIGFGTFECVKVSKK